MRIRRKNRKLIKIILLVFLFIFIGLFGTCYIKNKGKFKNQPLSGIVNKVDYNEFYSDSVKTLKEKKLYLLDYNDFKEIGFVGTDVILALETTDYNKDGYFKIKDSDYYIDFHDIEKTAETLKLDLSWKNYIPYNESIKTNSLTNLYLDNKLIYSFNFGMTLPIIIKESDYYGIVYNDNLYYVKKDEVEVVKNQNTDKKHTDGISALVYHFVYDSTNYEEKNKCLNMNSDICFSDLEFESHLKYIKENGFYTATMKDIEMFVDGKIQLPERTVLITIDDGNFVSASIKKLEQYDLHATLFLIGVAGSPDNYKSDNLEIHSHTYDLHIGGCSGGQGSALKCFEKEIILADLKKSRESLNNTTYFCWPFFEYNDYAIDVLKEAGYKMAFAGGRT